MNEYEKNNDIIFKNMDDKKHTIMGKFFNIVFSIPGLNKLFLSKSENIDEKTLEMKKIDNIVEKLLITKNYNMIYDIVKNGYQLNRKQEEHLEEYIKEQLRQTYEDGKTTNKDIERKQLLEVEKYLSLGLRLSYEDKEDFIFKSMQRTDSVFSLNMLINIPNKPVELLENIYVYQKTSEYIKRPLIYLTQQLANHVKINFCRDKFEEISELILNPKNIKKCQKYLKKEKLAKDCKSNFLEGKPMVSIKYEKAWLQLRILLDHNRALFLKEIHFENFIEMYSEIQIAYPNNFHNIKETIKESIEECYKKEMRNVLEEVKNEYSTEYIKNITSDNILQSHTKVNKIPEDAQMLLDDITALYKKMQLMNKEDHFELTNLFEKRIPEILQKYLTIDESYRTTMVNIDNKNAQDLMIDSLSHIKSNFLEKWERTNEKSLESLSATNRYTRNFASK